MSPRKRSSGARLTRAINLLAFLPLASRGPIYGRLLLALAMDPRVPASPSSALRLAEIGLPREELDRDLARVRKTIPGPVRAVLARLPEALEAIAEVASSSRFEGRLREAIGARANGPAVARNGHKQTKLEEVSA